jgi:hypothetical protein
MIGSARFVCNRLLMGNNNSSRSICMAKPNICWLLGFRSAFREAVWTCCKWEDRSDDYTHAELPEPRSSDKRRQC